MLDRVRPRLTFANVVSVIALFVALGGTGLAASQLGKNSVGTKQLKKNAVTGAKVKGDSLTGSDINEATLRVVPSARNAQALGGMSAGQLTEASRLRCPSGMLLAVGVCFETAARPSAQLVAAEAEGCARGNLRLPTEGELITYFVQTATAVQQGEWVEPAYYDGTEDRGTFLIHNSVGTVFVIGTDSIFNKHPYRCVTMPSN